MTGKIPRRVADYIILLISMAGYVPHNSGWFRKILIGASLVFVFWFGRFQGENVPAAITYFVAGEVLYFGFISLVLAEHGFRKWFMSFFGGEEKGYIAYETILGFLFLQNGAGIGFIASSTPGDLFFSVADAVIYPVAIVMFIGGLGIKILAAEAVGIDIYYWKDMFMGRKISEFVVSGPYKYFSNPMYGIGQLQSYATALWYGSAFGLAAAFLNQILLFTFYYTLEKRFIRRAYLEPQTSTKRLPETWHGRKKEDKMQDT